MFVGVRMSPSGRFAFVTLPDVFAEKLVGGNVTYFADRRNSVGATAYGATETNLISGIDLDLQEWSRIPTGKTFGAAGGNARLDLVTGAMSGYAWGENVGWIHLAGASYRVKLWP